MALLETRNVTVRFGGIVALNDVSFSVAPETICGVIGPNGAGKTTLFNCLSRLYRVSSGVIQFAGADILNTPKHMIVRLGIGRTFQNLALFRTLTVRENVMLGAHSVTRGGFVANALRLPFVARQERDVLQRTEQLLQLLGLESVGDTRVMNLPFGTLKRVELGRALASQPKMLLLDEPAAGLNHVEVESLIQLIVRLRNELRLTVLLVEHHMNLVMRISDQVVAFNFGAKIADGPPDSVRNNNAVIEAYLGAPA